MAGLGPLVKNQKKDRKKTLQARGLRGKITERTRAPAGRGLMGRERSPDPHNVAERSCVSDSVDDSSFFKKMARPSAIFFNVTITLRTKRGLKRSFEP